MNQHHFGRRSFLRGLGVTVALPWLESRAVWGDQDKESSISSEPPVRLAVVFSGNGFHSREWWAKGAGSSMELGRVLEPLHDHREKLTFISGLYHEEAEKGTFTAPRRETSYQEPPYHPAEKFVPVPALIRCSPKATEDQPKYPASCWVVNDPIHPSTKTIQCYTALTSHGAPQQPQLPWKSIQHSHLIDYSKTQQHPRIKVFLMLSSKTLPT